MDDYKPTIGFNSSFKNVKSVKPESNTSNTSSTAQLPDKVIQPPTNAFELSNQQLSD